MIEHNRTIEYLKDAGKYKYLGLPKAPNKQPKNARDDINLMTYPTYDAYRDEQCKYANKKRQVVFEDEKTIENLCVKMRSRSPEPFTQGLVHGVRNGKFMTFIKQSLGIDLVSTEISPARSTDRPESVEGGWDFHNVKPEWENSFDFVWSSSYFHSYDPYKCIQQWMKCVKRGSTGQCILLHHAPGETAKQVERDIPFGANLDQTILMINAAGRDKRNGGRNFHVEDVWAKRDGVSWERSKYKRYIVVVPTL